MKKVINSYRNITQLHSGFSSGTDWNVDIFSIADYTDIAFTSGSRLTFAKFLEPTLFSVEVPELRRPQECICLGQEKEIPGRFAHMSRLAFLCLYEHAVLAPASPPPPPWVSCNQLCKHSEFFPSQPTFSTPFLHVHWIHLLHLCFTGDTLRFVNFRAQRFTNFLPFLTSPFLSVPALANRLSHITFTSCAAVHSFC